MATTIGRGIEPVPFDGRVLGEWLEKLQPGLAKSLGLAVMTNEARSLSHYNRSIRAFAVSARVVLRTYAARLRRQELLTNGASLIAQMLKIAIAREVPIWTEAPLEDLIVEDGRVVGVRTVRAGHPVLVRARLGVLLASGGFAHNAEMRERYGGDQPNRARWSIANPGDTGEALQTAMRHRCKDRPHGRGVVAAVAPNGAVRAIDARPGAPTSTHDLRRCSGTAVRERVELVHGSGQGDVRPRQDEPGGAVLADLRRSLPQALRAPRAPRPGRFPRKLLESGMLKQAWTLDDLAHMCDIDPAGLSETVERFNQNAAQGIDPDYGRGESAYNRALGDPNHKVHPCLGPIDEPPYYAVQVVPGDIGTCGGLVTDEHAQVVDNDDRPIEGLYATGNGTATVMGRHYLGPGASIANTMVFGYVAARHATREHRTGS